MAAAAAVSVSVATDLGFAAADASKLVAAFQAVDKDGSGHIEDHEVRPFSPAHRLPAPSGPRSQAKRRKDFPPSPSARALDPAAALSPRARR